MYLTGRQILEAGIVKFGVDAKCDDGILPSFGPDGCGYTLRGMFTWKHSPADIDNNLNMFVTLAPGKSLVVKSLESIQMPTNMAGTIHIKSTYGRKLVGLTINAPVDPGYNGLLTLCFYNFSADEQKIYIEGGLVMMMVAPIQGEHQYEGRHQNG